MNESELEALRDVSERLEFAGIQFMLTGSLAMAYYSQSRFSRDVDIVIALTRGDADKIVSLFKDGYYVSREAISRSIENRSVFNLIYQAGIVKIDCIVLKNQPS